MKRRAWIAISMALVAALPMAWADPVGGPKSIVIDASSYGKIYPAVWFDPGKGTVHKMTARTEKPPIPGAIIWIEPGDPEFRLEPGIKNCSMAAVGYGEDAFSKPPVSVSKKVDKLDRELLLSDQKPVVFIETANSKSLIIIDGVDMEARSFKFRWKLVEGEQE